MADHDAFAKEFLKLLKRSKFTESFKLAHVLQQHHTIITALNDQVLGLITQRHDSQELSQGLKGGGGPHRLDLVLQFSLDASDKTLRNSRKLISGILGP